MKKAVTLSLLLICLYTASVAQSNQIKTWSAASALMGMSSSSAQALIKQRGYEPGMDGQYGDDGVYLTLYVDKKVTLLYSGARKVEDQLDVYTRKDEVSKKETVVRVTFFLAKADAADASTVIEKEYKQFEKAAKAAGYKPVRTIKEDDDNTVKYYLNSSKGEKIKIRATKENKSLAVVAISIYKDQEDLVEDLED